MKILMGLLVVVLVAAAAGYFWLGHQHQIALEAAGQDLEKAIETEQKQLSKVLGELALEAARVLAAHVEGLLDPSQQPRLDEVLAAAVGGNRLVGVIVLAPDGSVHSSTDLRFRGRRLDDAETLKALATKTPTIVAENPAEDHLEVVVPLMDGADKVGVIRVFFEIGAAGED